MSSILPPNATKLEKVLVDVLNSPLEVSIRDLWNPQTCPKAFLPYLAQSYSVDRWDSNWSEQEKRAAIEAAFYVHKHKGTIAAVRRVVEPFGFLINVVEWWEKSPKGRPHTFELIIGVSGKGITEAVYRQMTDLIEDAKPLRSHLLGLDIQAQTVGIIFIGAVNYCGDITTIYPYLPTLISVEGNYYQAHGQHIIDDASVYPL
ncbi:phage tail protein I [Vibrio sp. AK197]